MYNVKKIVYNIFSIHKTIKTLGNILQQAIFVKTIQLLYNNLICENFVLISKSTHNQPELKWTDNFKCFQNILTVEYL